MQTPSLVELFIVPINGAGIEYMVTGGLAAVMYGHPRLTLDVDLVLRLTSRDVERFAALWPSQAFYCPPVEVIREEQSRTAHGHFNVIHHESAMRADVYLADQDELYVWAFQHRVMRQIGNETVRFAPIEYVIVNKLRYFQMGRSDRHLRDVAQMMEISGSLVDQPALDRWIARLDLRSEWALTRSHREME